MKELTQQNFAGWYINTTERFRITERILLHKLSIIYSLQPHPHATPHAGYYNKGSQLQLKKIGDNMAEL